MKPMKRKILTSLAALSLLFGVASTQGSYMGPGYGGHDGNGYGYPAYGGYGPSIYGPGYLGPWGYGYGYEDWWDDGYSDFALPPPAPNPNGPPKTIEIPPDHAQHHS
jgi:hypothetical protein